MIYRFIYASILYLVCFIPYWNVNKHEQSSSILDFDVCDLDWIIYRRVLVIQSPQHSTRIIYCVSLLVPMTHGLGQSSQTLDSPFPGLRLVLLTLPLPPILPAPDYDLFRNDGLCVYRVLNLRVAFQSMRVPGTGFLAAPPPPSPRLQVTM